MVKKLLSTSQKLFAHPQSNILSAAAVITGASLLSSLLGLLRNRLLVGHFFGDAVSRAHLDAYWVAFRLPELVFQLLVIGALSAAFIPVYSSYRKRSEEEANLLTSSMMNIILLGFTIVSVVIFIFAKQFNGMITSTNFTADQVELAAQLSRVMLFAQFFFAISNFLTGLIQAHHRFLIPALSPLAYNVGIIAGIVLLTPLMGIYGPAVGVVLGAFLHLGLQLPLAFRLGYRYRPLIVWKHAGVREILRLMPPRALAISANQLEVFVTVFFATALSTGSLTIMNLAQQLISAPLRIFSVPIGQASLPFLSHEVAEGRMEAFKRTLLTSLHHILFLALPASVLLIILRIPLVRLAYGSGEFPWSATLLTGKAVAILGISMFADAAIQIINRGFYALHNTRLPFVVAFLAVLVTIGVSFVGVHWFSWGVIGLSVGLSTATLMEFTLLFVLLWRQVRGFSWSYLLRSPAKIAVCSAVMGVGLWVPMRLLDRFVFDTTHTVPLIGLTVTAGFIGAAMYFCLASLLKVPEVAMYARLLRRVGNWQQTLSESEEVLETPSQSQEINPL